MTKNTYFAYRSFWPEWKTMEKFSGSGVNTICFFPANTVNSLGEPYCKYPPIWQWFDNYDFQPLDQQVKDILEVNPQADLICIIDLNTPLWLARQLSVDSFHQLSKALCDKRWLSEMHKFLEAFLKYSEEKYADHIKAYVIASGQTDEWMDYNGTDICSSKEEAYLQWCDEQGINSPERAPSFVEAEKNAFDGCLYDPADANTPIHYWRFSSELIADSIIDFAEHAKKIIRPQAEIGVFYGYIMELDINRHVKCGHLAYEKVLQNPYIDFTISPGAYGSRPMGEGSGFMIPEGTIKLYGKRHLHECDQRTHCYNNQLTPFVKYDVQKWNDLEEDLVGMKREMALALIKQTSLWWFDMWGGFYQAPEIFSNLEKMKDIWNRFSCLNLKSNAEIALVVDPESSYMINDASFLYGANSGLRNLLSLSGMPFDVLSFNDLDKTNDLEKYKFVIFTSVFELDPRKYELLQSRILNNNRTILWLYAPGISDGKSLDIERVEKLSGTKFKTSGINTLRMDSWTSVYCYDFREIRLDDIRNIACDAGVHSYTQKPEVVYSNEKLLAVHTAKGGAKQISLPNPVQEIVELYSGKTVALDTDKFIYEFQTPDTALFELRY